MWSRHFLVAWASDPIQARMVRALFDQVRVETLVATSVDQLRDALSGDSGVVLACGDYPTERLVSVFNAIRRTHPHVAFVVVQSEKGQRMRLVNLLPEGTDVVEGSCVGEVVVGAVSAALIKSVGSTIEAHIVAPAACHPLIRAATRAILRSVYVAPDMSIGTPSRSLKAVANQIGTSRDYLARLTKRRSYPIGHVASRWLIAQVALVKDIEDQPWARIAWRCGYESASGLSDLCSTRLGIRLSQLSEVPSRQVLRDFGTWLASLLTERVESHGEFHTADP